MGRNRRDLHPLPKKVRQQEYEAQEFQDYYASKTDDEDYASFTRSPKRSS